ESWQKWMTRMTKNLIRAQNADGSWTGDHCITGRTFCTAAALMILTIDTASHPIARGIRGANEASVDRTDQERGGTPTGALLSSIDAALASAARFLVSRQSPDGAWRSETYGFLRDGPSLTPHVLSTLFFLDQGGEHARASFRRGAVYLERLAGSDGRRLAGA